MKQTARILSIYAADTSGVCSALYELGGMTVVHDASGCNSTYTTHDEPRWYRTDSMVYISALTEMDAVMGGDAKLIDDTVSAAKALSPRFVALCGSPMPMMIGTDFDAIAEAVEKTTGIPTIALHTNGMHSYLDGASEAFDALLKRFCAGDVRKTKKPSVNILGATPLDLSVNKTVESIRDFLEESGFEVIASTAMNTTLDDIARAGEAHVNLVVSSCGIAAAKQLKERFGTPFVSGIPFGEKFSALLVQALHQAAETGENAFPCAGRAAPEQGCTAVVGEAVYAGSFIRALALENGESARMLCPLDAPQELLAPGDANIPDEEDTEREFAKAAKIIADPLYQPICRKDTPFVRLPHEAFSGRCFRREIPNCINRLWKENF